jgi:hypothetical protein
MQTVLLVAASPLDQDRLRLANEVKQAKRALERSRHRENWKIESNEAATVDDLRRALLDFRPTVVHFSGHGAGSVGLAFEDDAGGTNFAQAEPLTRLFHHFKDSLKCVVLNACYSEVQANAIRAQIDYVVGMSGGIDDESATKFAVAFYDAVFAETTFRQAFDIACTAIELSNLPDKDVPVLLTGPNLGSDTLAYSSLIPQIEDTLLAYFNAPFSDRYKFTTRGVEIADAMRKYYGDGLHITVEKVSVASMRKVDEDYWQVRVLMFAHGEKEAKDYYLRIRDREIRVEWEASVGYWTVPPTTYRALGTEIPIVARVRASLGTGYYGSFRDQRRRFQCIDLHTLDNERFWGYVPRHAPEGKELIALLSDGNEHDITLSVGNVDDETDNVRIQAVLSRTWILPSARSE